MYAMIKVKTDKQERKLFSHVLYKIKATQGFFFEFVPGSGINIYPTLEREEDLSQSNLEFALREVSYVILKRAKVNGEVGIDYRMLVVRNTPYFIIPEKSRRQEICN